jgi:hypothetical protein
MQQGDSKVEGQGNSLVGASSASGSLSVGGKNFSIPEQAALLLQRAFEAMKEPSVLSKQVVEEVRVGKGGE